MNVIELLNKTEAHQVQNTRDIEGLKKIERKLRKKYASENKEFLKDEAFKIIKDFQKNYTEREFNHNKMKKYINSIFGNKNKMTYKEFRISLGKHGLMKGDKWIVDPNEDEYQTVQRLIRDEKLNKTVSNKEHSGILSQILKKYKNEFPDSVEEIQKEFKGHFSSSSSFVRYTKLSDEWIHIDAIQTDFFNKVKEFGSKNEDPEVKKLISEILSKEDESYKTVFSYIVRKNPNVKIWTMNTSELVRRIEKIKSDDKAFKLYTVMPKKLGFKLIDINNMNKFIRNKKILSKFISAILGDNRNKNTNINSIISVSNLSTEIKKAYEKNNFELNYLQDIFNQIGLDQDISHQLALKIMSKKENIIQIFKEGKEPKDILKSIIEKVNNENIITKIKGQEIWWANRGMLNEENLDDKFETIINEMAEQDMTIKVSNLLKEKKVLEAFKKYENNVKARGKKITISSLNSFVKNKELQKADIKELESFFKYIESKQISTEAIKTNLITRLLIQLNFEKARKLFFKFKNFNIRKIRANIIKSLTEDKYYNFLVKISEEDKELAKAIDFPIISNTFLKLKNINDLDELIKETKNNFNKLKGKEKNEVFTLLISKAKSFDDMIKINNSFPELSLSTSFSKFFLSMVVVLRKEMLEYLKSKKRREEFINKLINSNIKNIDKVIKEIRIRHGAEIYLKLFRDVSQELRYKFYEKIKDQKMLEYINKDFLYKKANENEKKIDVNTSKERKFKKTMLGESIKIKNLIKKTFELINKKIKKKKLNEGFAYYYESEIEKAKPKDISLQDKRKLLKNIYKKVLDQMGQSENTEVFMQMIDSVPEGYLDYELQIDLSKAGEVIDELINGDINLTREEVGNLINIINGVGIPAIEKYATGEYELSKETQKFGAEVINKNSKEFLNSIKNRKDPKNKLESPKRTSIETKAVTIPIDAKQGLTANVRKMFTFNLEKNSNLGKLAKKIRSKGMNFNRAAEVFSDVIKETNNYKEFSKKAKEKGIEFTKDEYNDFINGFNTIKEKVYANKKNN